MLVAFFPSSPSTPLSALNPSLPQLMFLSTHTHTHTDTGTGRRGRSVRYRELSDGAVVNGMYASCSCKMQMSKMSKASGWKMALPERPVMVPPYQVAIGGLQCHSNYSVRIRCANEVGSSAFSSWVNFQTPESGNVSTYISSFNLSFLFLNTNFLWHLEYITFSPMIKVY